MADTQRMVNNSVEDEESVSLGARILTIGIGQGGASWVKEVLKEMPKCASKEDAYFVNLSSKDLKCVADTVDQSHLIQLNPTSGRIASSFDGAGKNRITARGHWAEMPEKLNRVLWNAFCDSQKLAAAHQAMDADFHPNEDLLKERIPSMILIAFSTDGGTGSGLGPLVTSYVSQMMLNSEDFANRYGSQIPVFGVGLLPDITNPEIGSESIGNSISCMKEISASASKRLGRFLLIRNDYGDYANSSLRKDRYDKVNMDSIKLMMRYLNNVHDSTISTLDNSDRWTSLSIPGIHAFATIPGEEPNAPADIVTADGPFVIPDGANVARVCYELPDCYQRSIGDLRANVGYNAEETLTGYYEANGNLCVDFYGTVDNKDIPIIHFAGFSNLNKIAERYDERMRQIIAKAEKQKMVDAHGTGFKSNLKELKARNNVSSMVTGVRTSMEVAPDGAKKDFSKTFADALLGELAEE